MVSYPFKANHARFHKIHLGTKKFRQKTRRRRTGRETRTGPVHRRKADAASHTEARKKGDKNEDKKGDTKIDEKGRRTQHPTARQGGRGQGWKNGKQDAEAGHSIRPQGVEEGSEDGRRRATRRSARRNTTRWIRIRKRRAKARCQKTGATSDRKAFNSRRRAEGETRKDDNPSCERAGAASHSKVRKKQAGR